MLDNETTQIDAADKDRAFRAACAEIDRRVRLGETRIVETWSDTLSGDTDRLVELVFTEFATREAHGQSPRPEEYYERFPGLADHLQRLFQVDELLKTDETIASAPSGDAIGPYELREKLGAGGMGVVYRGWHPLLNRDVAIKVLGPLAGDGIEKRFLREAQAIAALNHPNIVHLYDVGEHDGRPFLVMEYVAGGSLRDRLAGHMLGPIEAATLVATLADAIHYAHSQRILHRDLKPGNVLLDTVGSEPKSSLNLPSDSVVPKIADFGLATRLDRSTVSTIGHAVGTPSYMAPEQAEGKLPLTSAVDVYALGIILYEALIGRPPFLGDSTSETLLRLMRDEPVPPRRVRPEIPRDLQTVCLKCLNKQPARRYASAAELAADLRRFLAREPILASAVGPMERTFKFARRRPVLTAALVATVLAVAVIGIVWVEFTRRLSNEAIATKHQRDRADKLREKADVERNAAEIEREKAIALLAANREHQYVSRLVQVAAIRSTDPLRAREMLASPEWCPPDRRDFAWHYFGASCRVERFSVEARANGLNALAVAKNGQLIVVGGANGSVVGFTPEGKQAFRFDGPHKGLVSNVAVTVDGKNAISASTDGVIRVGSVDKHGPMRELGKLEEPIYALAVTPDGTVFAGGGRRTTGGKIAAWDLATGARKPAPPNERGVVRSLAVAPDGDTLLVGLDGGEVLRWSIAKSTPLSRFRTQLLRVQNLAVRSDGMIAVVGPTRSEVSLWDGPTGRKLRDIATARGVWSVQFSPEGHTVAVGEHGNQVSLWRVSDGQPVRTLYAPLRRRFNHTVPILAETTLGSELPNLVVGVGFAAEDLLVTANADDRVSAWALDTSLRAIVNRPSGLFGNELIPLDDGRMAIISANDRKLYRADLTTGEMAPIVDNLPKSARLLVQSIDRKSLYLALGTGVAPKQVVEWTVQARQFPDLAQHFEVAVPGPVTSLLPRPEGLMIVCRDGNVYEWRHNLNEQPVARWSHPEAPAYGAYLAASNRLVTLSAKESIVWPEGRRLNAQFPGPVRGVEACPDGKTLAVWVYDPIETRPRIYLWDAGHDSPPYEIDAAKSGIISVAFSPDGRTLGVVGADHLVRLVNVATRETLLTLADDKLFLRGLVFAPDGKSISTMRLRNEPLETRIVTWRIPDK